MIQPNADIGAVVVLFNPDWKSVLNNIDELLRQVGEVCYVDNTPMTDMSVKFEGYNRVRYIPLRENRGIAAAQNVGIKYFLDREGIENILFLDQDSQIQPGLAVELKKRYDEVLRYLKVIAIGPQAFNAETGKSYVWESSILDRRKIEGREYWIMRNLPSSYSLTPIYLFRTCGLFNEELFIDGVEHEWMWRAKSMINGELVIVPDLHFCHQMGTPFTFLGRKMSKSTPFRLFYQTRNVLWICKLPYSPKSWKKQQLKRLVVKSFWYPMFVAPRFKYMKSIVKGILQGIFRSIPTQK